MAELPLGEEGDSRKLAFITIGATATFEGLIRAALSPDFFQTLKSHGYDDLLIQYGLQSAILDPTLPIPDVFITGVGVRVMGFDFRPSGLKHEMLAAAGRLAPWRKEGCVISHAGSGTILDALRISAPLIVIPNTTLLDNHQVELAEELERQDYVVHGSVDKSDGLTKAVARCESWKDARKDWAAVNCGQGSKSLQGVLDEELGFAKLD